MREISRAVEGRIPIEALWMSQPALRELEPAWLERLAQQGTELVSASREVMQRLRFGDRDEHVLAVIPWVERTLAELPLPAHPCVAIVEHVEKPGNVGAILRSADGAGISAVIVVDGGTDLMNPNVIRASMGTVFTVPNCSASHEELLPWVRKHGLQVVTARVDAEELYYQADFTVPTAIVLGSEAHGLGEHWREFGEHAVKLPMFGVADSLNVSATAAVLFYEVLRQRQVGARS